MQQPQAHRRRGGFAYTSHGIAVRKSTSLGQNDAWELQQPEVFEMKFVGYCQTVAVSQGVRITTIPAPPQAAANHGETSALLHLSVFISLPQISSSSPLCMPAHLLPSHSSAIRECLMQEPGQKPQL